MTEFQFNDFTSAVRGSTVAFRFPGRGDVLNPWTELHSRPVMKTYWTQEPAVATNEIIQKVWAALAERSARTVGAVVPESVG